MQIYIRTLDASVTYAPVTCESVFYQVMFCTDLTFIIMKGINRSLAYISFSFHILCLIGAAFQIISMTSLYFQYRVSTVISIGIDEIIHPLATTLCVRYTDVLDYDRIRKETGRGWQYSRDLTVIKSYKQNLTAKEIFTFTPKVEETLKHIRFRKLGSYRMFRLSKTTGVDVEKFLYSEFICYKISLKRNNRKPMPHHLLSVTTQAPGMVYELTMTDKLDPAHYMKLALTRVDESPGQALMYIPVMRRGHRNGTDGKKDLSPERNEFTNWAVEFSSRYLPAPYETDCWFYDRRTEFKTRYDCKQVCEERKTLKELKQVSFNSIIRTPYDANLIYDSQEFSYDQQQIMKRIVKYCNRKVCQKRDCHYSVWQTTTTGVEHRDFRIRMNVPYGTSIRKENKPMTEFMEFFTFVSSAVSTWIGLSILTLDPLNLFNRLKRLLTFKNQRSFDTSAYSDIQLEKHVAGREKVINQLIGSLSILTRRINRLEIESEKLVNLIRRIS